jgi:hypothetical protein
MSTVSATFEHPIWKAVVGLLVGYGIVLGLIFGLFFVFPYLLF